MKQVIALALLSSSQALLAPQTQLKTRVAAAPVEDAEPVAPMTTLEAAVLEATGTEPAAVAPAPVAAPPVAPAAPPPAPKGRVAQKRTENWSDLALPFAGRPALLNRELAADAGFDPLSLADSKVQLYVYREAELKHARLAMLAAAGWPLSEKLNGGLSEMFNQKSLLVEGGRAPSILNGGLGEVPVVYWLAALGLAVAVEQNSVDTQILTSKRAANYLPGDLQVDPLGMDSPTMRGAEILNGAPPPPPPPPTRPRV